MGGMRSIWKFFYFWNCFNFAELLRSFGVKTGYSTLRFIHKRRVKIIICLSIIHESLLNLKRQGSRRCHLVSGNASASGVGGGGYLELDGDDAMSIPGNIAQQKQY